MQTGGMRLWEMTASSDDGSAFLLVHIFLPPGADSSLAHHLVETLTVRRSEIPGVIDGASELVERTEDYRVAYDQARLQLRARSNHADTVTRDRSGPADSTPTANSRRAQVRSRRRSRPCGSCSELP